ncbi:MAG TPA: response regulator [Terriglobales bacterium]|nr:response regulator [Terriglobales bacterium]
MRAPWELFPRRSSKTEPIAVTLAKSLYRTLPPSAKPSIAKPLILCVEDEPISLLLRKKVLERDGYNVIGVTTAQDAISTLREAPVCATIADHMLQGTTGIELARQMKTLKRDVPIILFSGTLPEHLDSVDVFIHKGEPTSEFLRIVRDVVNRYYM